MFNGLCQSQLYGFGRSAPARHGRKRTPIALLAGCLSVLGWVGSAVAQPTCGSVTSTFREGSGVPTHGTLISLQNPDFGFGGQSTLATNADVSNTRKTLISFPTTFGTAPGQFPYGSVIVSATLGLTTAGDPSAGQNTIHQIFVPWSESTATWNSFGSTPGGAAGTDYASTPTATFTPSDTGTLYTSDITALVSAWSDGTPNYGVIILGSSGDHATFQSDDYDTFPARRPTLTVTWSTDCDGNGIDDCEDLQNFELSDCNQNSRPDECEISGLDQVHAPVWQGPWTNIENGTAEQTFKPRLPNLTAVEIGLTDDVPGLQNSGAVTVRIFRGAQLLAAATEVIAQPFDGLAHFPLPTAVPVTPGETLSLFVQGGVPGEFGWQYDFTPGQGYPDGERRVNGSTASGDWIFRTHGTPYAPADDCNANGIPDACDLDLDRLYWANDAADMIQRADAQPLNVDVQTLANTGNATLRGFAVDRVHGKIYWSDIAAQTITRANLDGSNPQVIVPSPNGRAVDITLDLAGGFMYWPTGNQNAIRRADLSGNNVTTLLSGLSNPTGVALDLAGGKMYWTNQINPGSIQRANLDGSNVETVIAGLSLPVDLALDVAGGKMYWSESGTPDRIRRADLNGTNVQELASTGLLTPAGVALDLTNDKLYWSDATTGKIEWANLDGSFRQDVITGTAGIYRIDLAPISTDCDQNGVPDECEGGCVPAATITGAVSRKSNPAGPGGFCDLNLMPALGNEPRQGGVAEVRIAFDVPPAQPGPDPVIIEQVTCASPIVTAYNGASTVSAAVAGNELVLTFTPGLENARSYLITLNPGVTSIAGQYVEFRNLLGDVNGDGFTNALDRSLVVGAWTGAGGFSCPTDLNHDAATNALDRSIVVGAWTGGQNCTP